MHIDPRALAKRKGGECMVKVKCIKDFPCELCNVKGTLQILTKNYARVRHYKKFKDKKPVFEYHQQSKEYIDRKLNEIQNIDLTSKSNIDSKLNNLGFNNQNSMGRSSSLVRTLALRAKGRRFKSGSAHQSF